jgi:membrane-bound serine protease (ClpP class)
LGSDADTQAQEVPTSPAKVPVLVIKDTINVGTATVLERFIAEAKSQKLPAVVIHLDTPGGFLEATRDIVQLFLNTESPKIIVWVTPAGARATSAGSLIALASHYAAMASSTSIGAATPVSGGGEEMGKEMKAKITNDTLSFVEGIAQKRNRNVQWAKDSVSSAASLAAAEALKKNVIDGIHETQNDLWLGARSRFPELPEQVQFVGFDPSLKERVLSFFSNPNVAYGLMALGVLGIYMEISNPGTFIPGAIGALSLALGAITMKIVPIRPGALILLVVGLVLLIIEIFTPLPTYGVAGVLGVVSMFLSGLFLMDDAQTNITLDAGLWLPIFVVVVPLLAEKPRWSEPLRIKRPLCASMESFGRPNGHPDSLHVILLKESA